MRPGKGAPAAYDTVNTQRKTGKRQRGDGPASPGPEPGQASFLPRALKFSLRLLHPAIELARLQGIRLLH